MRNVRSLTAGDNRVSDLGVRITLGVSMYTIAKLQTGVRKIAAFLGLPLAEADVDPFH